MKRISQALRASRLPLAATFTGVLILAGCASTPPAPLANLAAARLAVSNAERGDGDHFAATDMSAARSRLVAADAAVVERKMILAERYADESRADAEVASAKTASAKAMKVNDEMKQSTGTLIEEMKRTSGDKP